MTRYEFYEIKSKKSLQYINGLRQVSLVCSDFPEAHLFLWLDQSDQICHLQFLFNEKLIEWFSGKDGIITSQTNRNFPQESKPGIHKGVRTIHAVKDDSIKNEGLKIVKDSTFPFKYHQAIKDILSTAA